MAIPIPGDVRELLDAPNYVHLATLRADGSPRNWVVWVGLEDDHILVCTSGAIWKAKDVRRDPRVALSVTDRANPYRMAAIQGRAVEIRPDEDPDRVLRDRRSDSCTACPPLRPQSGVTDPGITAVLPPQLGNQPHGGPGSKRDWPQ